MLETLAKKTNEKPCNTIDTLIGSKTEIKGDIQFTGGLRIDGKIRGNIVALGEGNSMLVLSEHAEVTGNVTVPHMIVNGRIDGNVRATERMELQNKGEITGDVSYKVIEIAAGASINGALTREAGKGAVVTHLKQADAGSGKREAE